MIQVAMPCGTFGLRTSNRPIVLIGAGIGCTPMLSMLETLANQKKSSKVVPTCCTSDSNTAKVTYIHCVQSSEHHCFAQHVDHLLQDLPGFESHAFYSRPTEQDLTLKKTQVHRRKLTKDDLVAVFESDLKNYEFYICGPKSFIEFILNILNELKVNQNQISFEYFGPQLQ